MAGNIITAKGSRDRLSAGYAAHDAASITDQTRKLAATFAPSQQYEAIAAGLADGTYQRGNFSVATLLSLAGYLEAKRAAEAVAAEEGA